MTLRAFLFGLNALIALFVGAYALLLPSLMRRDVLFGVTVAPDARSTAAGRRIIAGFRIGVALLTLVLGGAWLAAYALAPEDWLRSPWLTSGVVAVELLIAAPYFFAHFAARALTAPAGPNAAVAAPAAPAAELRPRHYGDYVSWVWELLPIAVIAATVAYLTPHYADAPALVPQHYDLSGHVDQYAPKSIGTYFILVWVQLFIEVLLTSLSVLIVGAKAVPGAAEDRFRRIWLRGLFGLKTLILLLMGTLAVTISSAATSANLPAAAILWPTLSFLVIVLIGTIALSIRTGQGGSRLGSPEETATDRTSDRYWKLGMIYVNPNDPAILVEQRFGIGWTVNFGNPRSLLVLLGVALGTAAFIVVIILVSTPR